MNKTKTKIHVLSYTNNEFYSEDIPFTGDMRAAGAWDCSIQATEADVIVLAGDIDVG